MLLTKKLLGESVSSFVYIGDYCLLKPYLQSTLAQLSLSTQARFFEKLMKKYLKDKNNLHMTKRTPLKEKKKLTDGHF